MIQRHDFNSQWWGDEVGIVSDPRFFDLDAEERLAYLSKFVWVEYTSLVSKLPLRTKLAQVGFFYTDTQVRFRLDLTHAESSDCARELEVQDASEKPFQVGVNESCPFAHERFYVLPQAREAKISERYALWARNLIRDSPATCLRFLLGGEVQGWFLARPGEGGVELTLAMLSSASRISGFDLYSRAVTVFAQRGFRLGFASFSVTNSAVHNIYSRLGARFLESRECWMWIRGAH